MTEKMQVQPALSNEKESDSNYYSNFKAEHANMFSLSQSNQNLEKQNSLSPQGRKKKIAGTDTLSTKRKNFSNHNLESRPDKRKSSSPALGLGKKEKSENIQVIEKPDETGTNA